MCKKEKVIRTKVTEMLGIEYPIIGARISYAISSAYSYQKWYRILSL